MLDYLIRTFKIFVVLLIFVAPALAPEIAIAAGVIIWGATYLFLGIAALFHSTASSLPWTVIDTTESLLILIPVVALFGLVNGFKGVIAMVVAWVPALLLPGYLLAIGLAVEHEFDWTGYVYDNYTDPGCEVSASIPCIYRPVGGRQLPSFVAERNNLNNVLEVIPYGN